MHESGKSIFKWILYILLLFLFYILQTTPFFLTFWGVKPVLIVPFAVCVSLFEREVPAAVLGGLAGLLWDFSSGKLIGFNAAIVMACCTAAALLAMYLVRVNWLNAVLICGGTMLLHGLVNFILYYAMWGYSDVLQILLRQILPTVLLTTLISPLMFLLARKIAAKFNAVVRV